jgi:hypothetical protein
VADEHNLDVSGALGKATPSRAAPAKVGETDELATRLAALKSH